MDIPISLRTPGIISLVVLALLCGCVSVPTVGRFCERAGFLIDANYAGGNFHSCSVIADRSAELIIRPEDDPPINQSPWYSFRDSPKGGFSRDCYCNSSGAT